MEPHLSLYTRPTDTWDQNPEIQQDITIIKRNPDNINSVDITNNGRDITAGETDFIKDLD